MNIERKKISLARDTYECIGLSSDPENALIFKTKIKEYISILNEIIESNFDRLTDKNLYELLSKIYCISFDEMDYLKILSKHNNKKYTHIHKLPTTMVFSDIATEGHGKSFDWWNEFYQVYYVAATSDQFKFDHNKTYSKKEIKKLLSDKSIVVLKCDKKEIDDNQNFVQEDYEPISPLNINSENYIDNASTFISDNYGGKLIRKKLTKKVVLKDIKKIINILNNEIEDILSNAKSQDPYYLGTSIICKEWFESSEEKKKYQNIKKTLKKIKKNNN